MEEQSFPGEDDVSDQSQDEKIRKLHKAIENGDTDEVVQIVNDSDDVLSLLNRPFGPEDSMGPLHFAVTKNRQEICQLLIYLGSDVNLQNEENLQTPLHMAIDTSVDAAIVNLLLQNGASTELYDEMDCTPFQLLFLEPGPENQFQFEKFQFLLEAGASVNTRAAFGAQPLHNSVKAFHSAKCEQKHDADQTPMCVRVTQMILEKGGDVNCQTSSHETPLHFAAGDGCDDIVRFLLESGALVNATNLSGESAISHLARHSTPPFSDVVEDHNRFIQKRIKTLQLLQAYNGDINFSNSMGDTPLHWLLANPSDFTPRMLEELIKAGAMVNAVNTRHECALHYLDMYPATGYGNRQATPTVKEAIVQMMAANGADVNLRNINGHTPLFAALQRKEQDLVEVLLQNGSRLDMHDRFGRICLHFIEMNDMDRSLSAMLMKAGVPDDIRDVNGMTCYEVSKTITFHQPLSKKQHVKDDTCHAEPFDEFDRLSNDEKKQNQDDDSSHNLQLGSEIQKELTNTENIAFNEDEDDSDDSECDINLDVLSPLEMEVLALRFGAGVGDDDDDPDSHLAKILGALLTPIDKNLNVDNHVAKLKSQLGDIESLCLSYLSDPNEGPVKMTEELEIIKEEINTLMGRIARGVKELDTRMGFTPVLSGSMSEGTKIGRMDEFDFLLYMHSVAELLDIREADDTIPGFVKMNAKPDLSKGQSQDIFIGDKLVASVFGRYLYSLIQRVLGREDTWLDLHFYWDKGPLKVSAATSQVCNLELRWVGREYNNLSISVDLAPVIHLQNWWPKAVVEQTLLLPKSVKNYGSLIVVCKAAPAEPFEGGHESYFRLSYSHMETRIFNSLPLDIKYSYVLAKILMENISKLVPNHHSGRTNISSYMLKMAFFTQYEHFLKSGNQKNKQIQSFSEEIPVENVRRLTSSMFAQLENCIKSRNLPSFFLPPQNIIRYHSRISIADREICMILHQLLKVTT
ncbi:uncharacterized protein LOC110040813 isoform X1 [Orbicella faveolata]|uniref:uncharacterized protein LOC110040813 isoform X1 n=2 Tax=Orbicella faveolata TaxID=48498 RepID=UPI0009E3CD08|nr:uncharacterized protein LOC110040813 isoform X1 [Orbicella faveolata]